MTDTVIETKINRKFTVYPWAGGVDLKVEDTANNEGIFSVLQGTEHTALAAALLGENATVITDLPEATAETAPFSKKDMVEAGESSFYADEDPKHILKRAKEYLAIHKYLVEQQTVAAKEAEVAKAKEAELAERRDALAQELRGWGTYDKSSETFQKAIDRIIELEEAAK